MAEACCREREVSDAAESRCEACMADVVGGWEDAFLYERCVGRGEYLGRAGGCACFGKGADALQRRARVVAKHWGWWKDDRVRAELRDLEDGHGVRQGGAGADYATWAACFAWRNT